MHAYYFQILKLKTQITRSNSFLTNLGNLGTEVWFSERDSHSSTPRFVSRCWKGCSGVFWDTNSLMYVSHRNAHCWYCPCHCNLLLDSLLWSHARFARSACCWSSLRMLLSGPGTCRKSSELRRRRPMIGQSRSPDRFVDSFVARWADRISRTDASSMPCWYSPDHCILRPYNRSSWSELRKTSICKINWRELWVHKKVK